MIKEIQTPFQLPLYYLGLGAEAGPLPAFIYFALSGEESLNLPPYNRPALALSNTQLRIYSITIPGHGIGFNKFNAMQYWAEKIDAGEPLLEDFFDTTVEIIHWLIEEKWIDTNHLSVGGLSRGGFIATHIAARIKQIRFLLGFAPLTDLKALSEFSLDKPFFKERIEKLNLTHLIDDLMHLHYLRFYIGNCDQRVDTDACYHFLRQFAEKSHEKKARHCHVEMTMTQSIGHKGHGTAPQIFEEGARWLQHHLLER